MVSGTERKPEAEDRRKNSDRYGNHGDGIPADNIREMEELVVLRRGEQHSRQRQEQGYRNRGNSRDHHENPRTAAELSFQQQLRAVDEPIAEEFAIEVAEEFSRGLPPAILSLRLAQFRRGRGDSGLFVLGWVGQHEGQTTRDRVARQSGNTKFFERNGALVVVIGRDVRPKKPPCQVVRNPQ